jgi:hypothetical protein
MRHDRYQNREYGHGRLRREEQTIWPVRISPEYELVKPIQVTRALFGPNGVYIIYYGDKTGGFRDNPLTGRGRTDTLAAYNLLEKMQAYLAVLNRRGEGPALSDIEFSHRQELSDILSPIRQIQN